MSMEINKKFVSLQMSFFFLVQARFLYECDGCGKAVGGCDGGGGGGEKRGPLFTCTYISNKNVERNPKRYRDPVGMPQKFFSPQKSTNNW